jgi:orotate phosphoribosyltransferase
MAKKRPNQNIDRIAAELAARGVVIKKDHFVYASGMHGRDYINKDIIYPNVSLTAEICSEIALNFAEQEIDMVVAPEKGGIILSTWIAHWIQELTGRKILSLYAEKTGEDGGFAFRRGYGAFIPKRRILVVEDVLTTGGSVKKVIETTRNLGGEVLGLGAIFNRGGVKQADIGDVPIFSLFDIKLRAWDEKDCHLCKKGIPVNELIGKGREFLARRAAAN